MEKVGGCWPRSRHSSALVRPVSLPGDPLMCLLRSAPLASLALVAAFAAPPTAEKVAALEGEGGKVIVLPSVAGRNATVVVFLCFDCPVSNSYVEQLNKLARE